METTNELMAAFGATDKQQWIAQAARDLKGLPFETLQYTTPDGILIQPFYTPEDIQEPQPVFSHTDWEICESIRVDDEAAANRMALDCLNRGATALIFKLPHEVRFDVLLKDIGISYIALQLELYGNPAANLAAFDAYLQVAGIDKASLNLTLNYDPLERLLQSGSWAQPATDIQDGYRAFTASNPGCRNLCVNAKLYHNAGATPAYEIGCMLAHANEYLTWLDGKTEGISIQLNTATGPDYFMEIAKLRALRKVFALLLSEYGMEQPVYIHATSARRNLTSYDHYNNLLRTTTEAMAAVAGGCNSLRVLPFDSCYAQPDDFSRRLARNTQLILKGESYFDKMSDAAAGAYFIETLTEALARKGWAHFQAIEAAGGLTEALKQGLVQDHIAASAEAEQALFDAGKKVLVGTNKFPAPEQQLRDRITRELLEEVPAGTDIRPLVPVRLAAAAELERLSKEKTASIAS